MTSNLCIKHYSCVLCEEGPLRLMFSLQDSPLAENYTREAVKQEKYPLELYLCTRCKHLQLLHAINQRCLFLNYSYQSNSSPGLIDHFAKYAERMKEDLKLKFEDLIVDIGSNDGTLLKQFKNIGIQNVIGVEPSEQLCLKAIDDDIPTYCDFFTHGIATIIQARYGKAKLITANNVFAHSRHLDQMVDCVYRLLDDDGTFVIEVSYLPHLMKNMVFDFIYHEHLCYHRFKPLQKFFQRHNMRIISAQYSSMKGGSIRFIVVKSSSERQADSSIHDCVVLENDMKLDEERPYYDFFCQITGVKYKVRSLINHLGRHGKNIIGYGASATTTTLLHHFEIGQHFLYLVDDNPHREGLYSPGYNIPVRKTDFLNVIQPDYIFISAWRFAKQIMNKWKHLPSKFIVPLPNLEIFDGEVLCLQPNQLEALSVQNQSVQNQKNQNANQ